MIFLVRSLTRGTILTSILFINEDWASWSFRNIKKCRSVFRTAASLARVTQPREKSAHAKNFSIRSDSSNNGAFKITALEGIVFVHDYVLLRNSLPHVR